MDKAQKRALTIWLRSQSKIGQQWLRRSMMLGVIAGLLLIGQAALLAHILHQLIINHVDKFSLLPEFLALIAIFPFRALCAWGREIAGYRAGEQIREHIRGQVLNKLKALGPAAIAQKPAGSWATLALEQIEQMQDFFAKYLPQMVLAVTVPLTIVIVVFPFNWAAGLIFLGTAPLVPIFMALVGISAADANKRNFESLQRLSGHFYDRLQSLATIRLFDRVQAETEFMQQSTESFRKRTMEVLRLAFLSSAVLEFFTALSIAIVAVYFGFSYIGELNFGDYGRGITLFIGLFVLILAPEFYQPLRDLGAFYHAKAEALGAAESVVEFLDAKADQQDTTQGTQTPTLQTPLTIEARDLVVRANDGSVLLGPVSFTLAAGSRTAVVGTSGAGKSSLVNAILGFLPYQGSLTISGHELRELDANHWRSHISWVGQNPQLLHGSVRDNLCLGSGHDDDQLWLALKQAHADSFVQAMPEMLDAPIGDRSSGLSVGQAQRLALTRAILQQGQLWLLDEATASLDACNERLVQQSIDQISQGCTTLAVSHRLDELKHYQQILVLKQGQLVQQGDFATLSNDQQGEFALLRQHAPALQGDIDA